MAANKMGIKERKKILSLIKKERSLLKKQLLITALISKMLEERGYKPPIIVGGCALSYYTREVYSSLDIDLVYNDSQSLSSVLFELGFKKEGRYFVNEEYSIVIENPASVLKGSESRTECVELEMNLKCMVIGIEDIIIDRMNACKHWKSKIDCEMAELLIAKYKKEIEWKYLLRKAGEPENDIKEEIKRLKCKINGKTNKKV